MSKIVIPEFVVCHKFSGNIIRGILIEQREKCDFTHNVSSKELSIFIGFTSSCFNIDALILKITKKRQKATFLVSSGKLIDLFYIGQNI